ncbi:MAG: response regulator [Planctomycetota bacterium]|jgi:DNA-binding NarL/FixJ family response regulator
MTEGKTSGEGIEAKKVFLVDDHPVLRKGIALVIDEESDLALCGEAETAAEALEAVARTEPDVVLVDLSLKDSDGLELIRRLHESNPDLPVLVVSAFDESRYAERALKAGARGYIMKGENIESVVTAIRHVLQGGIHLSEAMMPKIVGKLVEGGEKSPSPREALTDREFEVYQLIGGGLRAQEIAERLGLSPKTIHVYRDNIRKKLKLKDAFELHHAAFQFAQQEARDPLYPDSKG